MKNSTTIPMTHSGSKDQKNRLLKIYNNALGQFKKDQTGGLFLDYLATKEIIFDKDLNKYVIIEKIGNYYTKTPVFLTPKEYAQYRLKRDMMQYFKDKVSATNPKKNGSKDAQKEFEENLKAKEDIIAQINSLSPGDLDQLEAYEQAYGKIGFVPKEAIQKVKDLGQVLNLKEIDRKNGFVF